MYIGENLTSKQVATLQAIADASCGCRFTSYQGLYEIILNKPNILLNRNDEIEETEINQYIDELADQFLVDKKIIKGKPHVGLTSD